MKVFLINRADIQFFSGEEKLCVFKENSREFIDAPILQEGNISLRAVRKPELFHRFWWLYAAFFWIIGIFGLFTPKYSRFDYGLDCNITLDVGQSQDIWLRFNHYVNKKSKTPVSAVTVSDGVSAQIENGFYIYDKISRRRRRIYKLLSWLLRIVMIIAICLIII